MHLASAFLAPLAFGAVASARFVMYYDQYHTSRPTNAADRAGIDHVVLAFVNSSEPGSWKPFVPIETMRSEYPNAKLMAAIGGWGDTQGFGATCKSKANMAKFAKDVKNLVDQYGLDGVDCDWEYPGGNGADYKQVPNSAKVGEIDCFPKLLATVRAAIGPSKILSIAVPAKKVDMIAYTKETGPKIWPSVDLVNLMAYDFMNRRDNETDHHTSVAEAKAMVKRYLNIGCPPEKMNLGIAFYAKYFQTQGDCSKTPLGCPIVPAENPDGSDAGTSGAYTFETVNMTPITNASSLPVSTDYTCGLQKGRCANSCCSQYGNCGTTPAHCGAGCQFAFGTGCTGPDVAGSWQTALKEGQADEKQGGQYFFDAKNKLFWTWDTLEFMDRKFKEVVEKYGLGGVMSWSLGEDTYDYSHIRKLGQFAMNYHPYKGDRGVEVEVDGQGAEAEVERDDDDVLSKRKRAHIRRGQAGAHHFRA